MKQYFMESDNPGNFYNFLNTNAVTYLEDLCNKVHNTYNTEGNLIKLKVHCQRCDAAHSDTKYANMTFELYFEGSDIPFTIDTWVVANASFPTSDEDRNDISIGGVVDIDLADAMDVHYLLLWLLDHYYLNQFKLLPSGIIYYR